MMRLTIPGRFPALNNILASSRKNRYSAARMKRRETERVYYCAKKAKLREVLEFPCRIEITCYEPNHRRDWDGVVSAAMKFVLDGLQLAKVIPNDNQRHVWPVVPEVRFDKANPRVEVTIIEHDELPREETDA